MNEELNNMENVEVEVDAVTEAPVVSESMTHAIAAAFGAAGMALFGGLLQGGIHLGKKYGPRIVKAVKGWFKKPTVEVEGYESMPEPMRGTKEFSEFNSEE